jgi:hypothetical protein
MRSFSSSTMCFMERPSQWARGPRGRSPALGRRPGPPPLVAASPQPTRSIALLTGSVNWEIYPAGGRSVTQLPNLQKGPRPTHRTRPYTNRKSENKRRQSEDRNRSHATTGGGSPDEPAAPLFLGRGAGCHRFCSHLLLYDDQL